MTTGAHQQRPHNHWTQCLNRRHLYHSPFRLCQVRILTLICLIFPVLCQIEMLDPGASTFLMTPTQSMIYRPSLPQESHEAPSASSSHYHSPSPYGIQTPPSWVMQTSPHSLFYQGELSSQYSHSE
ncbi:hypothetical protein PVK06_015309 [Gossypium arboreum]|uniref:Uncharacterized protein n=1 Tax=Gossypium arboreum TaxID=29729 RepID=A0ABR0PX56_GOSAR|nr:hypothetical protein PVK06_015309 [Gossypium arboreum]